MSCKIILKKFIDKEDINKENPYQKYDKESFYEMYGIWLKVKEVGINNKGDIPYFYLELEEIMDEDLVKCRKAIKKKTRNLKAIIKELYDKNIIVKDIIPIFFLDENDLTMLLETEEIIYLEKDKEKIEEDYSNIENEIYNYLIKIEIKGLEKSLFLKEIEDLEFII